MGRNLLEQSLLDGEVLRDGLDDPIATAQQIQIVFKVARGDESGR